MSGFENTGGPRLRVLMVIKSLIVRGGGAERVFVELANYLADAGHELTVVTFDARGQSHYPLLGGIKKRDLELVAGEKGLNVRVLAASVSALRKLAKEMRPDICVAFMHSSFVPATFALLGTGIPVIASEHTEARHYSGRPLERLLHSFAVRLASRVTMPADTTMDTYPRFVRKKSEAIPNPIRLGPFQDESGLRSDGATQVILSVGRLMEEKDHETLIRAFAKSSGKAAGWRLRIVGAGPLRSHLGRVCEELQLSSAVEFGGYVSDVAAEYRSATLVCIPSKYESFGLVAVEAQASGRAVIAFSDCAGCRQLIQHGETGWLVEPGSDRTSRLAEGLDRLMKDMSLRDELGRRARDSAGKYGHSAVLPLWEALLLREAAAPREKL